MAEQHPCGARRTAAGSWPTTRTPRSSSARCRRGTRTSWPVSTRSDRSSASCSDAGRELLEQRRACYEQQAAAHAELADQSAPRRRRLGAPGRRRRRGARPASPRTVHDRTRIRSSTPSTRAGTSCSGRAAAATCTVWAGRTGDGQPTPDVGAGDPADRRRVLSEGVDAGSRTKSWTPGTRRRTISRAATNSQLRRTRRWRSIGCGRSAPAGPTTVRRRGDDLRWRNRIGAEQFPRPLKQGAHLVELLLQQRVTHGRYAIRAGAADTIHPPCRMGTNQLQARGISALMRSSSAV